MKEYTFQAIKSYLAESEEKAWEQLQNDLKSNTKTVFELIQELEHEDGCSF